jgi:small conductance mechanosensitive channel
MENVEKYVNLLIDWLVSSIPELLLALGVLLTGLWLIKKLTTVLKAALQKSEFTVEITSFLVTVANIAMKVLLVISVAGMVGVNTAAFVGVLAAGGLAIGLALQGSLGNFAAGIIIVSFKPYKISDWIEVKDKFGKVRDIQIFNTVLLTPGNKTLIIPNGEVINGIITNFSKIGNIRLELKILLPYSEDFPMVRTLILEELSTVGKVLKSPAPEVGIESFGDTNLEISVRPYVKPDDYWEVYFDIMQRLKQLYHTHGIHIAITEGMELVKVGK